VAELFISCKASIFVAMSKSSADTPLMQQHKAIKQKYPDAILLFRVGDFYETFGEDAIITSQVLGITLTKRNNGALSAVSWQVFHITL
jgi:DNA mismatch repair protein MutS